MKKGIYAVLALLTVFALVLGVTSCGGNDSSSGGTKKYTVTLNLDGGKYKGNAKSPITVKVEDGQALPATYHSAVDMTKDGYTFNGWKDGTTTFGINSKVTKDITLKAQWIAGSAGLTVTFDSTGGSDVAALTGVTPGTKIAKPADPTRATSTGLAYTFVGWFKDADLTAAWDFDADTVTSSITLYAKWTPPAGAETFDVNFDTDGGSAVGTIKDVVSGEKIKKPTDPTKEGYTFVGWFKEKALTTEWKFDTDTVTASITLYAKWSRDPVMYTVKFDLNGGTGTKPADIKQATEGATITLPEGTGLTGPASRPNFAGWKGTTGGVVTSPYTPTGNITLYASWTPAADALVEEFKLWNNVHPLFSFTLPSGAKWDDYTSFVMDFKVADSKDPLRHRIVGNYTQIEVNTARIGTSDAAKGDKIAVLGSWPNGSLNRFVQYQAGGGSSGLEADFPGVDILDDEFFTAKFPAKDYTKANGDYDGGTNNPSWAVEGRKPVATATGPFVYGFGFCSLGGQGTTHQIVYQITNVQLVNADGTKTVNGMPVYYKSGTDLYRAFCGQLEQNGTPPVGDFVNTQNGKPEWTTVSGATKIVPIKEGYTNPADITITYNLNYPNSETGTAPAAVSQTPGKTIALPVPADPTTGPEDPTKVWSNTGWFTAATSGIKVTANTIANTDVTLYAQWEAVDPAKITFDNGGGTGSTDDVSVKKGTGLTWGQLQTAKDAFTAPAGKSVFGGFYTVNTSSWTKADYTKLVSAVTKFDNDATIYAYWYAPSTYDYSTFAGTKSGIITKDNNARIDEDGYIIFATGGSNGAIGANAYLGNGNGDTMIMFKWPEDVELSTTTTKVLKITYALKDIVLPGLPAEPAGAKYDAAYGVKRYNTFDSTVSGNYASWNRDATEEAPLAITKAMNTNWLSTWTEEARSGIGFQINGSSDGTSIRAGYIYGIKIISIEYTD